jgi:predicted NodU family carbamoyl transferase
MSILGIIDTQIDCGMSLIKENKIVSSVNEERVIRKKLTGGFPYESLKKLLNDCGESEKDIEKIIVDGIFTPPWFARKFRYIQKLEDSIINKKRQIKLVGKLSDIAQNKLFLHVTDPTSTTGQVLRKFIPSIFRDSLPEKLKKRIIFY